jgi:hypothetical protein
VEEAARRAKRFVPIVCRALDGVRPHNLLRDLNYIHFYAEKDVPGSGFGTGLMRSKYATTEGCYLAKNLPAGRSNPLSRVSLEVAWLANSSDIRASEISYTKHLTFPQLSHCCDLSACKIC